MNKKEILKFYDDQPIVILSTIADGVPQTRALVNLRNKNIAPHLSDYFTKTDRIFLMTNTHSDKISEIKNNHNASIYMYTNGFGGMLLTGKIVEIMDDKTKDEIWEDGYVHYYPSGRHGGDFSVLEFMPEKYKTYNGTDFKKEKGEIK